jgi:hypothetical protein
LRGQADILSTKVELGSGMRVCVSSVVICYDFELTLHYNDAMAMRNGNEGSGHHFYILSQ